jgi:hypothetical protein
MTREQQIIEKLEKLYELYKNYHLDPQRFLYTEWVTKCSKLESELKLLKAQDEESSNEECKHEFVMGEYISQPYGTCLVCGRTIIK